MPFSRLDRGLWLAAFVLHCAILGILILRSKASRYPVFASLVSFEIAQTVVLFLAVQFHALRAYFYLYWTLAFIDYAFQVALVYEIGRDVLHADHASTLGRHSTFGRWSVATAVISLLLCVSLRRHNLSGLDAWEMRINIFTSILTAELFLFLCLAINKLGLPWNSYGMNLGQGLCVWVITANLGDLLYAAEGSRSTLVTIDHVRMYVYLGVLTFWLITFSFPKREFGPPPTVLKSELASGIEERRYNRR